MKKVLTIIESQLGRQLFPLSSILAYPNKDELIAIPYKVKVATVR